MTSLSRSLLLGLLLLVVFLGVALTVQWWLLGETGRLRRAVIAESGSTLEHALALAPADPDRWNDELLRRIAGVVGGRVELMQEAATSGPTAAPDGGFVVVRPVPGRPGWFVRATVESRALARIQLMHQRALVAIVLLAALLVLVPVWLALFGPRRNNEPAEGTRWPWKAIQAHAAGMEHFARMSVERGAALEQEHGARVRAEEDLQVNRSLLGRSQAERIRLGRELHDNICQTLYAVSLTLESAAKKMPAEGETGSRLDQCIKELRRLNREVRDHIRDLEPDEVRRQSLAEGIAGMLAGLPPDTGAHIDRKLDEDAMALAPPQHAAEIVSILREALSNSLRHSGARQITVRAERSDEAVAFAVVDDGCGFLPRSGGAAGPGHGLANMEARANAIGGTWRLHSSPGNGTRVLLTLPVRSPT